MTHRILSAEIAHETNTFSSLPTDQQAFRDCYYYVGEEALVQRARANTELAGFVEVAQEFDWHLEHLHSAAAGPSGKVTRAAFDWLCDPLVEAVRQNRYDGILLGLHGAMVTDFCEDGEAEILQRLRDLCGSEVPIAITLDLHANVSQAMCELADIIVSYKTYPHVDMREAGNQAARLLQATLQGDIHPQTIRVGCPMLEEVNGGRTDVGPMIERLRLARDWEQRADVHAVSINGGFASADIATVGPTVLVTAEGDMEAHRNFATKLADDIWQRRNEVINDYLEVDAAAAIARQFDASEGPLIIADYADNPGAGGYGDSTNLLNALLEAGVSDACFGPIVDGETVQALWQYEPGASAEIQLGGKIDPLRGGGSLALRAELLLKSDGSYTGKGPMIAGLRRSFGPSVVIRIEGIEVLVTTLAAQMLDLQQFRSFDIEPASKSVVALKSMQHFRADFEPIAARVIVCDSGALCTPRYRMLDYRHVQRPIFPLDAELDV
jgi:microcystin degradation protein MlrC